MKDSFGNHYERAFQNWLIDNRIQYIAIDEHKRAAFARCKVKSFDFLVYPANGQIIIAEVKGRKFNDYRSFMKRRSPKWQTVTLPADKFRQCAVQISEFLF